MSRTKRLSISYLVTYPIAFAIVVVLLAIFGKDLYNHAQGTTISATFASWTIIVLWAFVVVIPVIMLLINILLLFHKVGTIARILLIIGLFIPWLSFVGALIALLRPTN
ncbi:Hypothetical protein MAGb_6230 [Mycoplasmopsis agalactiae 14628]|uniref:Uncharacterized protein n=1 Tax=Mycoplasmopsis agalactiae 14628 TaxID=1110504 RepID=I5D5N6_MYCAA|nr:hypothetical protein [Mycoplasmopsis agalactiae]EIN14995.1 Hypothetical protein MAGb_6230 [Mycoplasmopsis agalactiae 14628]